MKNNMLVHVTILYQYMQKGILFICKVCRKIDVSVNYCSKQDSLKSERQRPHVLPQSFSFLYVCPYVGVSVDRGGENKKGPMRGEKEVLRKRVGESDRTMAAEKAVEKEIRDRREQTDRLRRQRRGARKEDRPKRCMEIVRRNLLLCVLI